MNRHFSDEIFEQKHRCEVAAQEAIEACQRKDLSVPFAVTATKTIGVALQVRLGQLESIEFISEGELEITLYRNHRKGRTTTTNLLPKGIHQAVDKAWEIATFAAADPCHGLADKSDLAFNPVPLSIFYPKHLSESEMFQIACEAEAAALATDSRIQNSEGAELTMQYHFFLYANSLGMLQSYLSTHYALSCCVLASQGDSLERESAYSIARDWEDLKTAVEVGQLSAQKALKRLQPRRLKTARWPVLLAPEVARSWLGYLPKGLRGDAIESKSSFLAGALKRQIFPEWFSIVEAPHLPKGLGSAPFDGEGVKTQSRKIIENGLLNHYLLNSYSARRLNLSNTGHANGIYNWLLAVPSRYTYSFEDLLKGIVKGLLVTELMGVGPDLLTGEYSQGGAGFWIENGEIAFPVNNFTLAGNLRDLFENLEAVGSDVSKEGLIQCGSLQLPAMQIAGE